MLRDCRDDGETARASSLYRRARLENLVRARKPTELLTGVEGEQRSLRGSELLRFIGGCPVLSFYRCKTVGGTDNGFDGTDHAGLPSKTQSRS